MREYDEVEIAKIEGVPLIPLANCRSDYGAGPKPDDLYSLQSGGAFVEGGGIPEATRIQVLQECGQWHQCVVMILIPPFRGIDITKN